MKHTPKNIFSLRKTSLALLLTGTLCLPQLAHATLLNMDFSAGFTNWSAEIIDNSLGSALVDPTAYPDNFSSSINSVSLTTSNDYWSVVLFQDLMFSPTGAGLMLSLNVITATTADNDFYFVQLRDLATDDILDLSNGGTFDISLWTGINLSFEMGIQDVDSDPVDLLTINNITLSQVDVPAPSSVVLFALGLLGISLSARKNTL